MRLREHPAIGEGRTDILPADPRQLSIIEGYNVRDMSTAEARAELDELKAKVKAHGVRTALVVKFDGEKIFVIEGHRRHKVAMELIAEYEASGGTEGRNIDFIPITAEKLGTSDIDRDFGLETSNSGSQLKPLELANLIHRLNTQRGQSLEKIAEGLGRPLDSVKKTLALRGILPEEVKEQVRAGDIAAFEAAKVVKGLAKGVDPIEAAKMIAATKEENKRLGVGAKRNNKVTAKTLKRDAPKPPAKDETKPELPAFSVGSKGHSPLAEDRPPLLRTLTADEITARAQALADAKARETADLASGLRATQESEAAPPSMAELQEKIAAIIAPPDVVTLKPPVELVHTAPSLKHLVSQEITSLLGAFAVVAEDNNLAERDPAEKVLVAVELLARADRLYRQIIGEIAA